MSRDEEDYRQALAAESDGELELRSPAGSRCFGRVDTSLPYLPTASLVWSSVSDLGYY